MESKYLVCLVVIAVLIVLLVYVHCDNYISSNANSNQQLPLKNSAVVTPAKPLYNINETSPSKELLPSNTCIVYLYYADWCPHCKNFKPNWNNLKNKYLGKVRFIEINMTNPQDIKISPEVSKLNFVKDINKVPTLYIEKDNKMVEYDGKLDYESLDKILKEL